MLPMRRPFTRSMVKDKLLEEMYGIPESYTPDNKTALFRSYVNGKSKLRILPLDIQETGVLNVYILRDCYNNSTKLKQYFTK